METQRATIADCALYKPSEMPDTQYDPTDTIRLQQTQLMDGKRLAIYFKQRLRHRFRHREQTGSEAARKNRNR
jgi:hypothetical protein